MHPTDIDRNLLSGFESQPDAAAMARILRVPVLDVVVPVYNEQAALESSIRRLHSYLDQHFPYSVRITIAQIRCSRLVTSTSSSTTTIYFDA